MKKMGFKRNEERSGQQGVNAQVLNNKKALMAEKSHVEVHSGANLKGAHPTFISLCKSMNGLAHFCT